MVLSAQRLYERGVDHGNAGRHAAAQRALSTAMSRTEDVDLRARITGTLAYIASRRGDPVTAERLCREGLADQRLGATTRAILSGQLGVLALMRGDAIAARELLTRGINGLDGDASRAGRMRINRSVAAMQLGDFAAARADLQSAADTFEKLGDAVERAKSLHNLGYLELLAGDLVLALRHMSEARPAFEAQSPVAAAQSDLDRAEVLRDAGLTTEAEGILDRVARTFGAHGMRQARAEAELSLSRSLVWHDPAAAAKVARSAARRFRTLGSDTWALRAASAEVRAQLSPRAYGPRGTSVDPARRTPRPDEVEAIATELERQRLSSEATAVRLAAELRFAAPGRESPPVRVPRAAPIGTQLLARQVRARHADLAGDEAEVRRQCARGLDDLVRRQDAFGSLDLRTSVAMYATPLMMTGLAAAVDSARPDIVFEWSERARHLSQSVVPLRPPPDPLLAADLAELRQLRDQTRDEDWLARPQAAALRDRARDRQWSATGAAGQEHRETLAGLRSALDGETGVLAYVWSGARITCVVATAARARVVDVADWALIERLLAGLRADLDVSASVRSGPMAQLVRRSLDERLAALSSALLDGPLAVAAVRRLVITVPGVLNGIPWAMLPGMAGHAFTLAASATRWVGFRGAAAHTRPQSVGFALGPGVARGTEEVARAASAWEDPRIIDGEATAESITDLASHVDILHIAAHGHHAVDNPLFSGLELGDGTLFGYDVDLMPAVPDTVVLSACEVGRSSVRWGEEAIGMTRVWLHAGTRCVIAAPVVVADDAACELLGSMHEGLAAGESPAESLARAAARTGIVAPFQAHGSGF